MVAIEVDVGTVQELADPKSFERGEKYFAAGHVRRISVDGTSVSATVDGTHTYRVRLDVTRDGLRGRCSCPYGAEVAFCKHCVATALAWLEQGGSDEPAVPPRRTPLPDRRLRAFLLDRDPKWLVDQLMAAAKADRVLRARLDVAAGADPAGAFDDRELRERLELAIDVADYVDYGSVHQYVHHVGEALDAVARLVDGGFPHAAVPLAEYALELLEDAADRVDDSDGGLLGVIARAEEIHLEACEAAAPDPVALAERLVALALDSEHDVFVDALPSYASVLGTAGLARYRELVEQASRTRRDDHGTVSRLMEGLAETA